MNEFENLEPEHQDELQGKAHLAYQEIRNSKPPIIVIITPPAGANSDKNEVKEIKKALAKK
jgi:hypothetical protein